MLNDLNYFLSKVELIALDLLNYFRKPKYYQSKIIDTKNILNLFLVSILLCVVMYAFFIPTSFITLLVQDFFPAPPKFERTNALLLILIFPILEELAFRLPLVLTKRNIVIAISAFIITLNYHDLKFAFILIPIIATILYILLSINKSKCERKLKVASRKYFTLYFYTISLSFGLIHIINFSGLSITQYLLTPIILLPQIIMGLILGYARVRYANGFIIALLMHISVNGVFVFVAKLY